MNSFRHAASIILASPASSTTSLKNSLFRVLMIQRKGGAAINDNSFVFPTAQIEPAVDFDPYWSMTNLKGLIEKDSSSTRVDNYLTKFDSRSTDRLPAFVSSRVYQQSTTVSFVDGSKSEIWTPPEHAFKIASLRALFTQCGLLLAKTREKDIIFLLPAKDTNIEQWLADRNAVLEDPKQFLTFCQKRSLRPCYFWLREWDNWTTSCNYDAASRLDTVTYMAVLNSHQFAEGGSNVLIDKKQFDKFEWVDPVDLLKRAQKGDAKLSLPEFYQLADLVKINSTEELKAVAHNRQINGFRQQCPVMARTSDGVLVYLLPGDDLYPKKLETTDVMKVSDLKEIMNDSTVKRYNRIVMTGGDANYSKAYIYKSKNSMEYDVFDTESFSSACKLRV